MKTTRVLAAALAALLLLAACGSETEPTNDAQGSPSPVATETSPSAPTSPSEEPPGGSETAFEVWFATGEKLAPERRTVAATPGIGAAAVTALLEGPTADDEATTAIPDGTTLNGLSIDSGTASVDLSDTFDDGGGSFGMTMRLAQVVFTLTQFPTVDDVVFLIDGEEVETFSGEGLVLDGPQKRSDYEELLPAISVESPLDGDEVGSVFKVEGTANVFEANVTIDVETIDGEKLLETFTTATCGTGCRGDFSEKLRLDISETTEVVLLVYESSAEDGSPRNVVEIHLTVQP